ncbi:MAG: hypothetical protein IKH28_09485 [Lachnospiraceae bacterium]|nr:hypothetical protein [Lachnospiraceae bacterium]
MGKTNLSKYAYHPARKEDLEINAVFYKMRDFRFFYFLMGVVWSFWAILVISIIGATAIKGIHTDDEKKVAVITIIIVILLCVVNVRLMIGVKRRYKKKDVSKELLSNASIYFPEECEGFLQRLQDDLFSGFLFARSASIFISNNFVLGRVQGTTFVAIPRELIERVGFEFQRIMFYSGGIRYHTSQLLSFYLTNGKMIQFYVNDADHPNLAVEALQEAGYQTFSA